MRDSGEGQAAGREEKGRDRSMEGDLGLSLGALGKGQFKALLPWG